MQAMKLNTTLIAIAMLGVSGSAMALPAISGDLNPSPDAEYFTFSHHVGGDFTDWISFAVEGDRKLRATVYGQSNIYLSSLTFNQFDLYDSVEGNLLATGSIDFIGRHGSGILNATVTGAATYWLKISGNFTVAAWPGYEGTDGYYSGSILSPVPEPSTYAMLGLGLGLLGFAARRWRK